MEEVRAGGAKNIVFQNHKYGASHWFQSLTFDGKAEVEQHGPKIFK